MATRDRNDDELEQIVREQKPGFTIERRTPSMDKATEGTLPLEGTPDSRILRRKASELESKGPSSANRANDTTRSKHASTDALVEKFLGPSSASEDSLSETVDSDGNSDADDIAIVDVRPEHASDKPDRPMRAKKVIISRSSKKIIGEQG